MKKQTLVSLAIASGLAAVALGSQAADNPFAVKPLAAGYQLAQADKKADGKCGEASAVAERGGRGKRRSDQKKGQCAAKRNAGRRHEGRPVSGPRPTGRTLRRVGWEIKMRVPFLAPAAPALAFAANCCRTGPRRAGPIEFSRIAQKMGHATGLGRSPVSCANSPSAIP
jgi:uncharacterized low-complexity protein